MTATPPPPPLATYPYIESGGSLLLAWQLRGKRVLIVGGGEVASKRLAKVLETDAYVTLVAPSEGLHPEVRYRIFSDPFTSKRITYHDRKFKFPDEPLSASTASEFNPNIGGGDLEGADMVLTAIDDVDISRSIYEHAHARKIPTNVADIPPSCDFYFGAQLRSGPLQVMVSTNGKGPKIASMVRDTIQEHVNSIVEPGGIGRIIEKVGVLRERLRERAPGVGGEVSEKRMKWMVDLCDTWTLKELGLLDERMMDKLLDQGWEKGRVPSFLAVGGLSGVSKDWKSRVGDRATLDRCIHLSAGIGIGATLGWVVLRYLDR